LKAIKFSNFYPYGERGLCRFVRAAQFSKTNKSDYIVNSNLKNELILQIEGIDGVNNFDSILSECNEQCSIFIGPFDLSQSLGVPGMIWDEKVINLMTEMISKCKDKKVKIGTFTDSISGVEHWTNLGLDFVEYASDLDILIKGFHSLKSNNY